MFFKTESKNFFNDEQITKILLDKKKLDLDKLFFLQNQNNWSFEKHLILIPINFFLKNQVLLPKQKLLNENIDIEKFNDFDENKKIELLLYYPHIFDEKILNKTINYEKISLKCVKLILRLYLHFLYAHTLQQLHSLFINNEDVANEVLECITHKNLQTVKNYLEKDNKEEKINLDLINKKLPIILSFLNKRDELNKLKEKNPQAVDILNKVANHVIDLLKFYYNIDPSFYVYEQKLINFLNSYKQKETKEESQTKDVNFLSPNILNGSTTLTHGVHVPRHSDPITHGKKVYPIGAVREYDPHHVKQKDPSGKWVSIASGVKREDFQ